jgi:hypothetical protein
VSTGLVREKRTFPMARTFVHTGARTYLPLMEKLLEGNPLACKY